jgi:hypothetical protein
MNGIRRQAAIVTMAVALGAAGVAVPRAEAQPAAPVQKTFASPQEAVDALRAALQIHDKAALRDIFGPGIHDLLTGDEAQDKANSRQFAKAIEENAKPLAEGDDKVVLEIGANKWPFPIPLVKADSGWRFDTAAGKEEIINRHVGKDEFHAIGVCETYVAAQKRFAAGGQGSGGLYWKTELNQAPSPVGARIAAAGVDRGHGPAPKPFHGYFFRILTAQGAAAPGGRMDYVKDGGLSGGFALVAYPERWGRSGVMTFIVNQDGSIFQRDLGEKTSSLAATMTEYDPGGDWSPVKDRGVLDE